MESAIEPTVKSCISKLAALEDGTSERIARLRERVHRFVVDLAEQKKGTNAITIQHTFDEKEGHQLKQLANKLLHKPTMQIRQGSINTDEIEDSISRIENQLIEASLNIGY